MLSIRRMVIRWCMWRLQSPKLTERDKLYYHFKLASYEEEVELPLRISSGFESFQELNEYIEHFLSIMKGAPKEQKRKFEYELCTTYRDRYFYGYDYETVNKRLFELYDTCRGHLPKGKSSSLSGYPGSAGIMAVKLANEFANFKSQIGHDYESKATDRGER